MDMPYGGGLPTDAASLMRMLPAIFGQAINGARAGMQGAQRPPMPPMGMGSSQPMQNTQTSQPQQNPIMSGVNSILDPNKGFMMGLLKGAGIPNTGNNPVSPASTPITNTPSMNMGNNPFMQMPWQNSGVR